MTIFLCFLAALLDGADIVSMGLAAPSVARHYGFSPGQISYILTAAIVGLMIGAAVGGRLGDRIGRKRVLIAALVVFAAFSLATAGAASVAAFVAIRLLCGIGLGAAFPNLIAIVSETAPAGRRATAIGLMFCGQPVGGSLLGLFVAAQGKALDWHSIFIAGGALPFLLVPILIVALPESRAFAQAASRAEETHAAPPSIGLILFGEGRAAITILLWTAYAFTQVIVYLINNMLPTLMVAKGFAPHQAAMISSIENMGAVAGCVLLGMGTDRGRLPALLVLTYGAIALSLFGLAFAQGFWPLAAIGIAIGFFAIGGQCILYALAPGYYGTLIRATGVGAAVSFGRLGGICGPLAAGQLLTAGVAPAGVLMIAAPFAIVAGAAVIVLAVRHRPSRA